MKFRAERTEFGEAVTWVLRTVGARATLPALSGVRMETRGDELLLSSTDLEIAGELTIAVQGGRDGVALVPGRLLGDIVRSLPAAAVSAEMEQDLLRLHCGRAQFAIRLMPLEDFPAPAAPAAASDATMPADEFARTVGQVGRAASADDARPVLTGVQLEVTADGLTASATDSYRLAMRTVPWQQDLTETVLVPRRALEEARRAAEQQGGEVALSFTEPQVVFRFRDRYLSTRLIEGKFPDVRQLVPAGYERRLKVERAPFMEVVRRVSVVGETTNTATPVTLHLSADTVRVTASSGEVGDAEEALPATLEGDDLEIAFNPRYLTDGLDAAASDEVYLEFRDELKPAVIRPVEAEDDADAGQDHAAADFLYLLMPVRV
ncbi:MAG: DNA polymerase III subunit beta [Egibacteraceae bacterium]